MIRRAIYLAQMLCNESLTPAILAARQARKLRALVRHVATNVPFYRDLYAAHGIRAASFKAPHDLQSLPIVDKHLLRAAGTSALSMDAPAKRVTITTSGSTGEPFEFQIDRRYDQWRKAQYLRPYLSCGQRLKDKVLRLTGHPTHRAPWHSRFGLLREWRLDCASDPARIVEEWRQRAPDVLQGYPSGLRSLAHHCLDSGETLAPAPRLVFTDSELLLPDTRALLEQAFGTPAIDIFGTFETDNIAYQCAVRDGYHIATDCVVLEIVRDGKPVPIGEEGEIVVTVLANRTLPFIRYNLRDIGRLSAQPCSCDLPFPLLAAIQGRANDLVVFADGGRGSPLGILERIKRFAGAIQHYQLRQVEIGRFELLVVPSSRFLMVDREGILNAIGSALGDATIELRLVEMIPPDRSGKRRTFISHLAVGRDG
jgi:phenylacetate-CoA ligase